MCKIWVGGFVGRLERYFRLGRIVIDLGVVGGQPCIGGLRILFSLIVRLVAFGKGVKDILDDFSEFGGDVRQVLEFAAWAVSERSLPLSP